MRFQAVAAVESEGHLAQSLALHRPPYHFELRSDEEGHFTAIVIATAVVDYHDHLPQITEGSGGLPVFEIRSEPQIRDLIGYLQHVESFGSFWCGIQKVHWETAEFSWIPENPEEESLIQIATFSSDYQYPPARPDITMQAAWMMIGRREEQQQLLLPISFFREGMNEFQSKRHLYAFFNFYFFLEDVFGGGKAKNPHILQQFIESPLLYESVETVLTEWSNERAAHHREMLDVFLTEASCDTSVESILKFIVKMRGQLHHFSQRSSQRKGHPLNQREFETLAFLLMSICLTVLPPLLTAPSTPPSTG